MQGRTYVAEDRTSESDEPRMARTWFVTKVAPKKIVFKNPRDSGDFCLCG